MDAHDLRLECLRLAHGVDPSPAEVVDRARAYFGFVVGTNDAEVLRAAHESADTVKR